MKIVESCDFCLEWMRLVSSVAGASLQAYLFKYNVSKMKVANVRWHCFCSFYNCTLRRPTRNMNHLLFVFVNFYSLLTVTWVRHFFFPPILVRIESWSLYLYPAHLLILFDFLSKKTVLFLKLLIFCQGKNVSTIKEMLWLTVSLLKKRKKNVWLLIQMVGGSTILVLSINQ